MAIIEQGKCKIDFLNSKGLGVATTSLGEINLPYVLPGEIVEFERHLYRNKITNILKQIIEASPQRIKPTCKYFGACGGCLLQHLNKEEYINFKNEIIAKALQEENIITKINPLIIISNSSRRRANFEVIKKNDQIFLGFHRYHSHQIINIDECPALVPQLSKLIQPLKEILFNILPNKQKAKIFLTQASNGIDMLFVIEDKIYLDNEKKNLLSTFAKENCIIKIKFRFKQTDELIYQTEDPYIKFNNIQVGIDAESFLQASFLSDEILSNIILKYCLAITPKNKEELSIVDLFCGRGTFTLPLSNHFNVQGFDSDKAAIRALKKVASQTKFNVQIFERDLFSSPLKIKDLNKYQLAILNPPRAGAKAQIQEMADSKIDDICYVSCNPESFIEDSKILLQGGYKLLEVTPVDQFYWSPHLEVVGFFKRLIK